MIRPTTRTVVLLAGGFPVALLPVFVDARLRLMWVAYVAFCLLLVGLDVILACPEKRLKVVVKLPELLYIGDRDALRVQISAPGRSTALPMHVLTELHEGLESQPLRELKMPAGNSAVVSIPLIPKRRGTLRVYGVWLRWPGPMGLVRRSMRHAVDQDLRVVPNVRAVRAAALRFFSSREYQSGLKIEHYVGDGTEFEALREYQPGFDHRAIDWKASARHCKLLCRDYRAERNHQVVLALDTGHLMREPIGGVPRLDHAINAALLLAFVCLKTGDRVGLLGFDAQVRLFTAPQGTMNAVNILQKETAALNYTSEETNFTLGITHLSSKLKRRSLVILFTDFTDTVAAELMAQNLDRLARRHLVLFVSLKDPGLEAMASAQPDSLLALNRAVVADDVLRDREIVLSRLRRQGISCIDAAAGDVSAELINRYLDIKRRELV